MSEAAAKIISFPSPPRTAAQKPNDVVWDACIAALGYEPHTRSEKSAWGKMTHSLTDAGATPERIAAVAQWYRKTWPQVDLTIYAIEKWYSHFLRLHDEKNRKKAAVCPVCEMGGGFHAADCTRVKS